MAIEISEEQALTNYQCSKISRDFSFRRNTPTRKDAEGSIRNDRSDNPPLLSFQSPPHFPTEIYFEWRLKSPKSRLLLIISAQKFREISHSAATLRNAKTPRAPFEMTGVTIPPFCHFNRLLISLRRSILNGD